jgi:hypothetical protein
LVELPKTGERIPVEAFHISECNVRHDEPFGLIEEDKQFREHLKFNPIREPMHARIETNGFGIYKGRRRYYGKKDFTTHFTVGKDVIIDDISEDEARESSFIENNEFLKKNMHPITYAEQLNKIAAGRGIRPTARKLNIPKSTVGEYLTLLDGLPSQKMREALRTSTIKFKDMLALAKLKLSQTALNELSEVLTTQGPEELFKQLEKYTQNQPKRRGLPKDTYFILRTNFDKRSTTDKQVYEGLEKLAKIQNMTIDAYSKKVLKEHVEQNT